MTRQRPAIRFQTNAANSAGAHRRRDARGQRDASFRSTSDSPPSGARHRASGGLARGALASLTCALLVSACATSPPSEPNNLCAIFSERPRWHRAAKDSERRWRVPVAVAMAVMYKESSFRSDAKPPRKKLFGVVPWFSRESSAYGFAQATDAAWQDYKRGTGNKRADRDKFADAVDFVGWYLNSASRRAGIRHNDARNLYIAYYAGIGGYQRGVWKNNAWLKDAAARVASRSAMYARQLGRCRR